MFQILPNVTERDTERQRERLVRLVSCRKLLFSCCVKKVYTFPQDLEALSGGCSKYPHRIIMIIGPHSLWSHAALSLYAAGRGLVFFNLMCQALLTLDRRPFGTADGGMDWGVREVAGESVVGM